MVVDIGGVTVGTGYPVYIIAEIGSNHDGSLDRATQLIELAAEAGADAAKFQLYRADKLYPGTLTPGAIPDGWLPELKACCHENGVEFLCSVFSRETFDAYMQVSPAAVKIASPEATDRELLYLAASWSGPAIVSTGALTMTAVDSIFGIFEEIDNSWARNPRLVLLHCVSAYPAPLPELNLAVITRMAERYDVPVGFSDHTLDEITVPAVAVAAGASVIEKHFTYDRAAAGADHPFALEPEDFASMVEAIRDTETLLGDGVKRPTASEDPTDRRLAA